MDRQNREDHTERRTWHQLHVHDTHYHIYGIKNYSIISQVCWCVALPSLFNDFINDVISIGWHYLLTSRVRSDIATQRDVKRRGNNPPHLYDPEMNVESVHQLPDDSVVDHSRRLIVYHYSFSCSCTRVKWTNRIFVQSNEMTLRHTPPLHSIPLHNVQLGQTCRTCQE